MAYCDVDAIKAEFKSITFTGSDAAVTTADVEEFITQASNEIDSRLSIRYAVPVTAGTSALSLLKQICTWIVSSRIKDITEVKEVNENADQDVKSDLGTRARKMLDQIVNGEINLIGATLASSSAGVTSYVSANNIERTFKRGEESW